MQTRILDVTVCVTEGQSIDCSGMSRPVSFVMGDLFQFYDYQTREIVLQKRDLLREVKVSITNSCIAAGQKSHVCDLILITPGANRG